MTISVRLEPALEAAIGAEAHRLGITKNELVKDSLVPQTANPYDQATV